MFRRRLEPQSFPPPRGGGVLAVLLAILFLISPAHAVQPDEILKDPAFEARARHISQELRCLVCQNQSIDDSNAELARDLRVIVRERITAGDTDSQVLAFVEKRYGEFVLLRPRLAPHTLLLWLTPLLLLGVVATVLYRRVRTRRCAQRRRPPRSPRRSSGASTNCWARRANPAVAAFPEVLKSAVPDKLGVSTAEAL